MPELPEVETVRRGLEPVLLGARFKTVTTRRADLRFPFPPRFTQRLVGARVEAFVRRGKYMIAELSTGESLILHLGMTGRFTVDGARRSDPGVFYYAEPTDPRHDHVLFEVAGGAPARIIYNDPRRFGFMDLVETAGLEASAHFAGMGPEPLGPGFTAETFNASLRNKTAPIKAALLDQRIVAGVGNIYACEALFRAGVSPKRRAASVSGQRGARLWRAVREVLVEAIEAGGSTLRDFAASDGAQGGFQQRFSVYDREGEPCPVCARPVRRIVQAGRSSFYCGTCQR